MQKIVTLSVLLLVLGMGAGESRVSASAHGSDESPLGTIERLHQAMRSADAETVNLLLHANYQGLSLQGPKSARHVFVETRDRAVSDIAKLKPDEWHVRFLSTSTRVDPNGLAQVWARYVFLYKGALDHCGYESYSLFKTAEGWRVISFADTDNALDGQPADKVCPKA